MTFEIKEGQAFIHKNANAEGNKPAIKGTAMIGGVAYDLAFWGSKSGKEGSYSGKITLPFKPTQKPVEAAAAQPVDDLGDIPF